MTTMNTWVFTYYSIFFFLTFALIFSPSILVLMAPSYLCSRVWL